ncbi:MAG: LysR family transcriptional activator of nhaA [Paraglaciecola sp.]|jgi:LysR family transcriptional activator of nhaA
MSELINHKHLHYFWAVAHEGSIAKASRRLHITPHTISGQLSLLEARMGCALFEKVGKKLTLTESGRITLKYADEIFELGRELSSVIRGSGKSGQSDFMVGAASALPKTIVCKIIEPALSLPESFHLISTEGPVAALLEDLAVHKLDMVISDTPTNHTFGTKAFNHYLGDCGLTFFAAPDVKKRLGPDFPRSLHNAPMLLPTEQFGIRQLFDQWLHNQKIFPNVVGQFDDSALIKAFGQRGLGVFFMPTVIADEVCQNFSVQIIGQTEQIKHKFYAISAERKISHPAVQAICETARTHIFSS